MIAGIGLSDEDRAFGVDGESIKKCAESIDGFDELIGFGIEVAAYRGPRGRCGAGRAGR